MPFSLLLHFKHITKPAEALSTIWQAWRAHFNLPLHLFQSRGPGQKVNAALLNRLAKFGPKDAEVSLKFKESSKRDVVQLNVWLTNPDFVDQDNEVFGDKNYISATLPDRWYRDQDAQTAETAIIGFISAVAEIGKLKNADFKHEEIGFNAPGSDLSDAIARKFSCKIGHIFFANAKMCAAYGEVAKWKGAGFQIHAQWKEGLLVGLPLDFEPDTAVAAWRLFDALETLGVFRRGAIKPKLLKNTFYDLSQAGDFLATYEKKLGQVFGIHYFDGIRPSESSPTRFGGEVDVAKPNIKSPQATDKKVVQAVIPATTREPIPAVPQESELDAIFEDFANAFRGKLKDATPIAYPEQLARDQLDYSHESLHLVDKYLTHLHKHRKKISDADWSSTILYGGAYVGEVIRRATNGHFRWIDYDEYMPAHPELKTIIPERSTTTCAFIVGQGAMSMPLNKIARYIDEGVEHSVHFLAHCDIQGALAAGDKKKPSKKASVKKKTK